MTPPDSRAPDAALRQRVADAIDHTAALWPMGRACIEDMKAGVLAALTTDAPKEEPRRVELDHDRYVTVDAEGRWRVHLASSEYGGGIGDGAVWYSAADIVVNFVYSTKHRDAKHAELIALKSEEVKPWGWVNVYEADPCIIRWNSEAEAKEAAVRGAKYVTRPLYEHPPAPTPAPQSETRESVGEPCAWMNVMTSGVTPLFPSEKRARDAVVIAGHYTEIAVPLVRQSPAGKP